MRNEYPRPDFRRDSFISLDEKWDFDFDDKNIGHKERWFLKHNYKHEINVPFCFESKLSGIGDTSYHDHIWYHKKLKDLKINNNERVILHFEGVDYYSEIYVNGMMIRTHYGTNCGFTCDITDFLNAKDNEIAVYCYDSGTDKSIPRGKQDWEEKSHAIWYTRTSGIYKPVWMEIVNKSYIKNFYLTTKIDDFAVNVELETTIREGKLEFVVKSESEEKKYQFNIAKTNDKYSFHLANDFVFNRLWTLKNPFLYDLTINLFDSEGTKVDTVHSYFGIREISTKDGKVLLNREPVYQKLVLNQSYFIDGILTAPSIKDMENDIDYMMQLGFNGCRIHQKTEDPYFLYLCDKKGFLIWQECAACYGYENKNPRRMLNEWIDIIKTNYNHPSIVAYTPLNESWGVEGIPFNEEIQAHAMSLYYLIHSLDSSRLVISNDGWEHCKTDLITVHNYNHGEKGDTKVNKSFKDNLSTREKILRFSNINRFIINPGYKDEGQPILLTEFGGLAYRVKKDTKGWGYTTVNDEKDYIDELKRIYKAIKDSDCLVGICYTQLTDVEQEINGLMTYDRHFKVDPKIIKEINDELK